MQNLETDDFKAKPPNLIVFSKTLHSNMALPEPVTGYLNIIENKSLCKVLSEGPQYVNHAPYIRIITVKFLWRSWRNMQKMDKTRTRGH